jgi:hypothetical protein
MESGVIYLDFEIDWGAPLEGESAESPLRTLSLDSLSSYINNLPLSIRDEVVKDLDQDLIKSIVINK